MAEKAKEAVKAPKAVNPRLAEIEKELALIKKKRIDYMNYVNGLPNDSRKAKRGAENMKAQTFKQEQALLKERAQLLKGAK